MKWLDCPEAHDFAAAEDYLSLLFSEDIAYNTAQALIVARPTTKKAKDILRASRLDLLPITNRHVQKNLDKIKKGEELSPVLLVRTDRGLQIADGYHRVCAVYRFSEDEDIPCRLVSMTS